MPSADPAATDPHAANAAPPPAKRTHRTGTGRAWRFTRNDDDDADEEDPTDDAADNDAADNDEDEDEDSPGPAQTLTTKLSRFHTRTPPSAEPLATSGAARLLPPLSPPSDLLDDDENDQNEDDDEAGDDDEGRREVAGWSGTVGKSMQVMAASWGTDSVAVRTVKPTPPLPLPLLPLLLLLLIFIPVPWSRVSLPAVLPVFPKVRSDFTSCDAAARDLSAEAAAAPMAPPMARRPELAALLELRAPSLRLRRSEPPPEDSSDRLGDDDDEDDDDEEDEDEGEGEDGSGDETASLEPPPPPPLE